MERVNFDEQLAFRFQSGRLVPIRHPHLVPPDELVAVEQQKEAFFKNLRSFLKTGLANDVLLWGARGTGKSALVKAALTAFADEGLRLVQVYKAQLEQLSELYELVRSSDRKFLLFFDDLSLKSGEDELYLLRSMLEGDLEERPSNLLVCATSNRRLLVAPPEREGFYEEEERDELFALAERFGLRLYFPPFGQQEFLAAVETHLKALGLELNPEALNEALRWASEHGYSGRSAKQFTRFYAGELLTRA
ncbi:MAG: DUF815 domain-containing protein [Aquificae bacterium]|nr:DUF815 domain-containing protein [Aquificota bacterium]